MSNPNSSNYGRYYWCVGIPADIAKKGEIYIHADEVEVGADGSLRMIRTTCCEKGAYKPTDTRAITLALPAGKWKFVFAASVIDGHAVSVEHWDGQIA